MYILAPSILSADFSKLGEDVKTVSDAGAQFIHLDVMDGAFVPSISFGMPVIKSIRKESKMFFDVHLMVTEPERYIQDFVNCGADSITVHAEACEDLERTIERIKDAGVKVGVSIKPATPVNDISHMLEDVDMVLVMTVQPGFGGQKFISYSLDKIRRLKDMAKAMHQDELDRVRNDPDEAKWAVQEGLRWEPGPAIIPRFAATDVTWHGIDIPAGTAQQITNTGVVDLVFLCICRQRFKPTDYHPAPEGANI